jgi:DNA-binding SARP family transcriptional activator
MSNSPRWSQQLVGVSLTGGAAVDDRLVAVRAEFGLLGPMYVRSEGVMLPLAAPGQRVVLAALAVRAGRVVSFEELSAAIWGDAPPPAARVAVRNQVSRLRHRLGRAGGQVVTRDPGYLLDAAEDDVDLLDFARLCREGGAAVRRTCCTTRCGYGAGCH